MHVVQGRAGQYLYVQAGWIGCFHPQFLLFALYDARCV